MLAAKRPRPTTSKPAAPSSFSVFNLPPEIRETIYIHAIPDGRVFLKMRAVIFTGLGETSGFLPSVWPKPRASLRQQADARRGIANSLSPHYFSFARHKQHHRETHRAWQYRMGQY